jgi:hypothetical protein
MRFPGRKSKINSKKGAERARFVREMKAAAMSESGRPAKHLLCYYLPRDDYTSLYNFFANVIRALDDNGIPYLLFYGALLGVIQHGRLIPWNDNVDLVIQDEATVQKSRLASVAELQASGHSLSSSLCVTMERERHHIPRELLDFSKAERFLLGVPKGHAPFFVTIPHHEDAVRIVSRLYPGWEETVKRIHGHEYQHVRRCEAAECEIFYIPSSVCGLYTPRPVQGDPRKVPY